MKTSFKPWFKLRTKSPSWDFSQFGASLCFKPPAEVFTLLFATSPALFLVLFASFSSSFFLENPAASWEEKKKPRKEKQSQVLADVLRSQLLTPRM